MDILDSVSKWVALIALLLSVGNLLWAWISRPARDLGTRLDKHREETDEQIDEVTKRIEVTFEGLKTHDRRIQRVEDDLRHLPTKDDLQQLEVKVVAVKTELDSAMRVLVRIDDHLRGGKS